MEFKNCEKLVVIVSGPVSSGKTSLAVNLAKYMKNCYYLDKDALVDCTYPVFNVADEPIDRHSAFFKKWIRDPEYVTTDNIALMGLNFNDRVIINAPYNKEIKGSTKEADKPAMDEFKRFGDALHAKGAKLLVVYLQISPEEMEARLTERTANDPEAAKRDSAIADIKQYCIENAQPAPKLPEDSVIDYFYVFNADNPKESFMKLAAEFGLPADVEYDPKLSRKL